MEVIVKSYGTQLSGGHPVLLSISQKIGFATVIRCWKRLIAWTLMAQIRMFYLWTIQFLLLSLYLEVIDNYISFPTALS